MKKLISLILILCLSAFALLSCGKDDGGDNGDWLDSPTLSTLEGWLAELRVSGVSEVKAVTEYLSGSAGTLREITSSDDPLAINDVMSACASIPLRPITEEDAAIEGGVEYTLVFKLKDGTVKSVVINNWNYRDKDGSWYTMESLPEIPSEIDPAHSYSIVTSVTSHKVTDADGNEIGTIKNLGSIEFYDFDGDTNVMSGYDKCIATEFGKIYVCSDTVFRFADVDTEEMKFFSLSGSQKFSELIIKN